MDAEKYLNHWEKNKIWTHYNWPKHKKRFLRLAIMCEGKTCIDIGCGFGHSTKILAGLHKADWTGLEFSEKAVKKARKNFPKINFVYTKDYNFEKACGRKYDTVVCSEVIEHIEDDKAFIAELMKITKTKLILTTPNRFVDDPGHLRVYTGDMLERLLDRYSFNIKSNGGFYYVETW